MVSEKHFHIRMDPRPAGLFVVVTHEPTGMQRFGGPAANGTVKQVTERLVSEIQAELVNPQEIEWRIGLATGGTFVEVLHRPTGRSRFVPKLGNRHLLDVQRELLDELVSELWQAEIRPSVGPP